MLTFLQLCCYVGVVAVASASPLIFAATSSDYDGFGESSCTTGQVGLLHPDTGHWDTSSCMTVGWADDAETASMLSDGTVLVYVTPGDGIDTFIAKVDFDKGTWTKAIVGGDQGNLRSCLHDNRGMFGRLSTIYI